MTYVITQPCCNDATCIAACPVDCIHPTPAERAHSRTEMLYIDPRTCIDCGACADVCPVDAILPMDDVVGELERYADLNAAYYEGSEIPTAPAISAPAPAEPQLDGRTLRVAIVGSGPAAFYAAEQLLGRDDVDTRISMFEKLPFPFGLVRYGVAPDHAGTKQVTKVFQRLLSRKGFELYLNVEVGTHVSEVDLLRHHHAVIYATGASGNRRLEIPGEDLAGSHAARDFVMWYNGHPDYAQLTFDLSDPHAVIVGNGNVALDVARILTSTTARLGKTDIADHALEALSHSKIRDVTVLGRRGSDHAAFSTPELINLGSLPETTVVVDPADLASAEDYQEMAALQRLRQDVLRAYAANSPSTDHRNIYLRFFQSPVSIEGDERVDAVRVLRNRPLSDTEPRSTAPGDDVSSVECGLLLRSIGFLGHPIGDLPFDAARGTVTNMSGRVKNSGDTNSIAGIYTAGWIKRGPAGVIGTNRECARETTDALLSDFATGQLPEPECSEDDLGALIEERQPRRGDAKTWNVLDSYERREGRKSKRPRVKLTDRRDISDVVESAGKPRT